MKKPSGLKSFPSPKRGVLRCVLRKPARSVKKPTRDDVPYVPVEQQLDRKSKAELRHQTWCCSLTDLVQWTERKLIAFLLSVGVLWKFKVCPHCRAGNISKLFHHKDRGWTYRCKASRCHKLVLPHAEHPFFTCGWGRSFVPLRQQVQVLFCNVARIDSGKTHIITGLGPKIVQSLSKRWRKALISYVEKRQDSTPFGNLRSWVQCEVDEVAVRGKRKGSKVIWHQYLGILERGNRKSLALVKLKLKTSSLKAKGKGVVSPPGPISKQEWKSIGRRYLANRKILLHTDGARAYPYVQLPGVITDSVKHKRPRPVFSALWQHRLPKNQANAHTDIRRLPAHEVETVWVKKGTQLIDNVWRQLKLLGVPKCTKADETNIHYRVREFQFHHYGMQRQTNSRPQANLWLPTTPRCLDEETVLNVRPAAM